MSGLSSGFAHGNSTWNRCTQLQAIGVLTSQWCGSGSAFRFARAGADAGAGATAAAVAAAALLVPVPVLDRGFH